MNYRNVFEAICELGDRYPGYVALEYGLVAPLEENFAAVREPAKFAYPPHLGSAQEQEFLGMELAKRLCGMLGPHSVGPRREPTPMPPSSSTPFASWRARLYP